MFFIATNILKSLKLIHENEVRSAVLDNIFDFRMLVYCILGPVAVSYPSSEVDVVISPSLFFSCCNALTTYIKEKLLSQQVREEKIIEVEISTPNQPLIMYKSLKQEKVV